MNASVEKELLSDLQLRKSVICLGYVMSYNEKFLEPSLSKDLGFKTIASAKIQLCKIYSYEDRLQPSAIFMPQRQKFLKTISYRTPRTEEEGICQKLTVDIIVNQLFEQAIFKIQNKHSIKQFISKHQEPKGKPSGEMQICWVYRQPVITKGHFYTLDWTFL